ncbi:PfkB family carbohydrate kinase [Domibacillus sp. DTU_2020_1001157_1_SI_ALB_TIR_016]|uniref:PfkB family carbohydrate kinase n=1 Tax=Domibacillus sp. DTU_2020_1001157_1_SI_ALB_TIR_016 TaxID=3077789 RepID=UPI0028F12EA1|nr:PfkB family carbohydrate kinase [Domibacillus sp. DTU_2020_1001157_1_SI_ALB_TIR_016]WNS78904.1 PfkB family carbohydrate kinase [Domibacillus sp. DTU_2020_1001157_1_SI_ALB_TIR_016]
MKIIGVGDNVVDYYKDREEIFPGGNAVNVAVLAKRYGASAASYMGIVGNDRSAAHLLESLTEENIDISTVRQVCGPNGESVIALTEELDRVFVGSNKGGVQSSVRLNFNEQDLAYIAQHDILHSSMYSHTETDIALLSQHIPVSFDFSFKYEEDYLQLLCPHVTYAFFSGSELTEEEGIRLLHRANELGAAVCVMTRGEKGAIALADGKLYKQGIVPAAVVDTLGAGDSFIAMTLVDYYENRDMASALQKAAQAAAATCEFYGAFGYGVPKKEAENIL